ncbi:MAG: cation:proton antiporter [Cyclobacteriaceae bacterium]
MEHVEIPLLTDITIILGASVLVIYLFQKFNLPTILGYLITGILAGPYVLSLVTAVHEVEVLAEIGVILLLFIIGMEFSLKSLAAIKNKVFIGGSVQVGLTILATLGLAYWSGFTPGEAAFLGFLFSLSSTAIVLKLLQERNEVNSPHGKIVLAILIFQDIIVVPMMLVTPIIAGKGGDVSTALIQLLLKAVGVIVVLIISARYIIPFLMHEVAKTKSRELFIIFVVVVCFAVAWATASIGLSLALGAFLAGLIISESEYSHQATSFIIPLREIFTSFFFVSIGMLLDVFFLMSNLPVILGLLLLVSLVKALIAGSAAIILRYPLRTAILTGLSLFQVGEFAFILSGVGIENGLLTNDTYQYFLSVSILSMGITPFVLQASPFFIRVLADKVSPEKLKQARQEEPTEEDLKDHTIIIGFGVNGRNAAQAARFANIPYAIIEVNANTVKQEKAKGEPIHYGDATHPFILEHLQVYRARVAIIAISDNTATKAVVSSIRSICPTVHIIVRTRFMAEAQEHLRLGASEVIPEEFETSIEIFTRLMHRYLLPQDEIEHFVQRIRNETYEIMRPQKGKRSSAMSIPEINISSLKVQTGSNEVVGKKIVDANIRSRYDVNILAIQRNGDYITHIDSGTEIKQDDILYVAGKPEAVLEFHEVIRI